MLEQLGQYLCSKFSGHVRLAVNYNGITCFTPVNVFAVQVGVDHEVPQFGYKCRAIRSTAQSVTDGCNLICLVNRWHT